MDITKVQYCGLSSHDKINLNFVAVLVVKVATVCTVVAGRNCLNRRTVKIKKRLPR